MFPLFGYSQAWSVAVMPSRSGRPSPVKSPSSSLGKPSQPDRPILTAVGPAGVYRIAGVAAVGATVVLLPMLRIRAVAAGPEPDRDAPIPPADAVIAPDRVG